MERKAILWIWIVAAIMNLSVGCSSTANASQSEPVGQPANSQIVAPSEILPPEQLPVRIDDPLLREAWLTLYNHTETIRFWNNTTTSGRQLAKHVLQNNIEVTWSTPDNICLGNSCAPRIACADGRCPTPIEYGPIYISPDYKQEVPDRIQRITSSMAHEIFHSTAPFGYGGNTQLEEFMAFYVSRQIVPNDWMDFKGYDPLNPICLRFWFRNHNLDYNRWNAYPNSVVSELKDLNFTSCSSLGDERKSQVLVAAVGNP